MTSEFQMEFPEWPIYTFFLFLLLNWVHCLKSHTINKESWIITTNYIVKLQDKPLCINYSGADFPNFRLALHPLVNIFSKKYCYNSLYLLKTTSLNTEDRYKDVHKLFTVKGAVKGGRKRRPWSMCIFRGFLTRLVDINISWKG